MSAGRDNKRLSASFQRPSRGVGRGGVGLRLANIAIGPSPSLRRRRHAIKRVRGTPRFAQPRSALLRPVTLFIYESANHAKRTGTHVKLV